jgi:hypothetical protein
MGKMGQCWVPTLSEGVGPFGASVWWLFFCCSVIALDALVCVRPGLLDGDCPMFCTVHPACSTWLPGEMFGWSLLGATNCKCLLWPCGARMVAQLKESPIAMSLFEWDGRCGWDGSSWKPGGVWYINRLTSLKYGLFLRIDLPGLFPTICSGRERADVARRGPRMSANDFI